MSLRSKVLPILSLTFAIALFSTFTMAQDSTATPTPDKAVKGFKRDKMARKGMGDRHGKGRMAMHGLRGIELTDAQKAQIKSIREANKPAQAVLTELRTIHEVRKTGTAITPEQKERIKAIREQSAAKAKSVHEQVLAVLTPEQKAQIETRKTEMRQRFENRKGDRKRGLPAPVVEKPKTI